MSGRLHYICVYICTYEMRRNKIHPASFSGNVHKYHWFADSSPCFVFKYLLPR